MTQHAARPSDDGATTARGIERPWDPRVWGTVVGAIGASVFVLANRGGLDDPWPVVGLVAWVLAMIGYVVAVYVVRRRFAAPGPVGPRSGLIYLASVLGMVALIQLGRLVLEQNDRVELGPALVVLAVGLHFLPFAGAFHTPMFTRLGLLMALLGAVGLVAGWTWDVRAAPAAAVVTGVVMLVVMALDALRPGRTVAPG